MATGQARAQEQDTEQRKRDLERNVDDSRESIAQTVKEIKDAVSDQFESMKQGITDTFDWHEQFRRHPIAWMVGALSVGYVLGNSLGHAFHRTKQDDHLLSYLAALGDKFTDELSRHGMSILAPALTGTILVPMLASKLDEAFGIDISDLPNQLLSEFQTAGAKKRKAKRKDKKKIKGQKKSKRKNGHALRT